jgi:hypothetical protein
MTMPDDNNVATMMVAIPATMLAVEAAVMITITMNDNFFRVRGRGYGQGDGDRAERCEGDDECAHYCLSLVSSVHAGRCNNVAGCYAFRRSRISLLNNHSGIQ